MTDQIKTIYSKFVSPVKKSTGIDLSEIGHAHAVNIILQELQNDNRTEKEKKDLRDYYRKSVYEYEKKKEARERKRIEQERLPKTEEEAFFINVIRIIIIGLFFGNMFSICFSIAGALVSFIGMVLLKSTKKISMITVAIIGGVLHNVGQIIIASVILKNVGIFTYVPILMIAGIITGTVIGILSNILYKRTREYIKL